MFPEFAQGDLRVDGRGRAKIRIAIVGLGRWGRTLVRAFSAVADVAIGCNQRDPEAHKWLRHHFPGIRSTFDIREVFGDSTIEAVVIATPVASHFELARSALTSGKHVFVEKPLATSIKEAQELVDTAARVGRQLFVGHTFLYHPCFSWLQAATANDPVTNARMAWAKFGTFDEDLVWNLLVHDVAMSRLLFGSRPQRVEVIGVVGVRTQIDIISVGLMHSTGAQCWVDINRCMPLTRKTVTILTQSGQWFAWEGNTIYQLPPFDPFEVRFESREEPLEREARAFVASVTGGRPALSDGTIGVEVVDILAEVERQAREALGSGVTSGPVAAAPQEAGCEELSGTRIVPEDRR